MLTKLPRSLIAARSDRGQRKTDCDTDTGPRNSGGTVLDGDRGRRGRERNRNLDTHRREEGVLLGSSHQLLRHQHPPQVEVVGCHPLVVHLRCSLPLLEQVLVPASTPSHTHQPPH
eukprot:2369850-Rhodomonas_salina.3